ncbi:hypothetical protein IMSAGC009_04137 [Lachnospiraceae bacterium]|nr:hypothetical protein IMSAGC009_04137 [Lachnospiraceae bacterium]
MVTHKHDDGIFPLSGFFQIVDQTSKLVIQMLHKSIIFQCIFLFFLFRQPHCRAHHSALCTYIIGIFLTLGLVAQLPFFPERQRHIFQIQSVLKFLWRIEGRMRCERIDADAPGAFPVLCLAAAYKFHSFFHAPRSLVKFIRHTLDTGRNGIVGLRRPVDYRGFVHGMPVHPFFLQPVHIIVYPRIPEIVPHMAPFKITVTVVGTKLLMILRTAGREMKFARKPTYIPVVPHGFRN